MSTDKLVRIYEVLLNKCIKNNTIHMRTVHVLQHVNITIYMHCMYIVYYSVNHQLSELYVRFDTYLFGMNKFIRCRLILWYWSVSWGTSIRARTMNTSLPLFPHACTHHFQLSTLSKLILSYSQSFKQAHQILDRMVETVQ